jgi:hypothetical protein
MAAVAAIEDDQWSAVISTYDGLLPATVEEFRAACATLPPVRRGATARARANRSRKSGLQFSSSA